MKSTSLPADTCFCTCDLLAQISVQRAPTVQLTTQPGSCSPPPGTYRSGAIISLLLGRCSSVRLWNTRLAIKLDCANEAVGNVKAFHNHVHSGLRGLPRFAEGICWATGLPLTTPFTEGRLGVNEKPRPLAVIRNRRLNSVALLVPLRSVQFSSVQKLTHRTESTC